MACEIAPVITKWKSDTYRPCRRTPLIVKEAGRKVTLSDAMTSKLADAVLRLTQKVSIACPLIRGALTAELAALGLHVTMSRTWTQRRLGCMGVTYQARAVEEKPSVGADVKKDLRISLQRKLFWMVEKHAFPMAALRK